MIFVPTGRHQWMWSLYGKQDMIAAATKRLLEIFEENRSKQRPEIVCGDDEVEHIGKKKTTAMAQTKRQTPRKVGIYRVQGSRPWFARAFIGNSRTIKHSKA